MGLEKSLLFKNIKRGFIAATLSAILSACPPIVPPIPPTPTTTQNELSDNTKY